MALHKEYLPPTQSQNSNIFLLEIPKAFTAFSFVLKATKWVAICFSSKAFSINQVLAVWALVMVSCVVKVLEAIKNKVSSAFSFFKVSAICVPSTLLTK